MNGIFMASGEGEFSGVVLSGGLATLAKSILAVPIIFVLGSTVYFIVTIERRKSGERSLSPAELAAYRRESMRMNFQFILINTSIGVIFLIIILFSILLIKHFVEPL